MIVIVDSSNREAFARQLAEMFGLRFPGRIAAPLLAGSVRSPVPNIDRYDTPSATYVLDLGRGGAVTAGLRLLPTSSATLLANEFSAAVAGELPQGPEILELSHWFVAADAPEGNEAKRYRLLFDAMFEFALAQGVTHLTAVCNIHLMPALLELGWSVVPLGLPVEDKGQVCIAILIEATTQMTRSIREAGLLPLRPGGGTSH